MWTLEGQSLVSGPNVAALITWIDFQGPVPKVITVTGELWKDQSTVQSHCCPCSVPELHPEPKSGPQAIQAKWARSAKQAVALCSLTILEACTTHIAYMLSMCIIELHAMRRQHGLLHGCAQYIGTAHRTANRQHAHKSEDCAKGQQDYLLQLHSHVLQVKLHSMP